MPYGSDDCSWDHSCHRSAPTLPVPLDNLVLSVLGVAQAMAKEGKAIVGRQYGDYAQSSGSGTPCC